MPVGPVAADDAGGAQGHRGKRRDDGARDSRPGRQCKSLRHELAVRVALVVAATVGVAIAKVAVVAPAGP